MGRRRPGALPILLARCGYFLLEGGFFKALGIILPALEDQLQTSTAVVGLVTAISMATIYMGCLLTKVLIHRVPERRRRMLASVAGLLAGCALIGASFTRNTIILGILFLITGLGCSVMQIQSIKLLYDYYEEDYAFVSTLSLFGLSVGGVVFSPITEQLLLAYGVGGTLFLIGAMFLNMVPIGLVLKERSHFQSRPRRLRPKRATGSYPDTDPQKSLDLLTNNDIQMMNFPTSDCKDSVSTCDSASSNYMPLTLDCISMGLEAHAKGGENKIESVYHRLQSENTNSLSSTQDPLLRVDTETTIVAEFSEDTRSVVTFAFPSSAVSKPGNDHQEVNSNEYVMEENEISLDASAGSSTLRDNRPMHGIRAFLVWCNIDVLINEPLFATVYLPSVFLLFLVTGCWIIFMVLFAIEQGIEATWAAYLPTTGAAGGVFAAIASAVAMRLRADWSPQLYLACICISTICCFLQTLYSSFVYLLAMSFLIGFGVFGASLLIEPVMALTVSSINFSNASSVFLFFIGAGYLVSGYAGGFVRDKTDDMKAVFLFVGAMGSANIVLALVLVFCLSKRSRM